MKFINVPLFTSVLVPLFNTKAIMVLSCLYISGIPILECHKPGSPITKTGVWIDLAYNIFIYGNIYINKKKLNYKKELF